jgi:hypothetical protein
LKLRKVGHCRIEARSAWILSKREEVCTPGSADNR